MRGHPRISREIPDSENLPIFPRRTFQHICKFLAYQDKRLQAKAVRGSPLVRFFILSIALAATGLGLMRVTSTGKEPQTIPQPIEDKRVTSQAIPFRLLLSAPATLVEIDTGEILRPSPDTSFLSGRLEIDPKNPHVGLIVKWKNPVAPGEHRFAKLTLEAPGKDTFTHTFDAAGDLDDFVELPLPSSP